MKLLFLTVKDDTRFLTLVCPFYTYSMATFHLCVRLTQFECFLCAIENVP